MYLYIYPTLALFVYHNGPAINKYGFYYSLRGVMITLVCCVTDFDEVACGES